MLENYLQSGGTIKLEIDVIPPYLAFWGTIEGIDDNFIVVKITGQYAQKEPMGVKCTIPGESKVCIFDTVIHGSQDNLIILKMPDFKNVKILQRRRYIRVPVDIPIQCFLIGLNEKKIEDSRFIPATVKDISGGGVLINSKFSLPIGTVVVFEASLDGFKMLLTAKVIRGEEKEEDGTHNLGCEFIGLSDHNLQKIVAFCSRFVLQNKKR